MGRMLRRLLKGFLSLLLVSSRLPPEVGFRGQAGSFGEDQLRGDVPVLYNVTHKLTNLRVDDTNDATYTQ